MTQKEIIEFERTNTGLIRLYLEGSFYKAYERSAWEGVAWRKRGSMFWSTDANTFYTRKVTCET